MPRTRAALRAATLLVAFATSACAGGDPGREYALLTSTYNATYQDVRYGLDPGSDLEEIRAAMATMADAERAFGEGLRGIQFPEAVRVDADDLLRLTAEAETIAREGAGATSWESARGALVRYNLVSEQASAASNRIRRRLDLPGVVTPAPSPSVAASPSS